MTYEDKRYWLEEMREELIELRDFELDFHEHCKKEPGLFEVPLDQELLDEYKYKIETIDEVLEDLFRLEELEY